MGKCNHLTNPCNTNYLFNQVILGQGVPPSGPACTVFCLIEGYTDSGELVTDWVIDGITVDTGGLSYTADAGVANSLSVSLAAVGCPATDSGYSSGGATGTDASYAWANIDEGCIAEEQLGTESGTFVAMECDQREVTADFSTQRSWLCQIESMTVNGYRYNWVSSTFNNTAAVAAEIQTKLEDIWGLTVTSVSVLDPDTDNVTIVVESNGIVESLTWDGWTTGSANFV